MYESVAPRWQGQRFMLDPVRSIVEFSVGDIVAALPVTGGTLTCLRDSWRGAGIALMVDVTQVQAGDPEINELLRSASVLDAANYPDLVFRGRVMDAVARAGDGELEISGSLRFRSIEFPLTLGVQYLGQRNNGHRFAARGMLRPAPCAALARMTGNAANLDDNAAVQVIMHTEWLVPEEPPPAA